MSYGVSCRPILFRSGGGIGIEGIEIPPGRVNDSPSGYWIVGGADSIIKEGLANGWV